MHQLLIRFAILFSFCLIIFIGFYLFISHRLLTFFYHLHDSAWFVWFSPVFILISLLLLFALSCYRYYAYGQDGEKMASYYQARKIDFSAQLDLNEKKALEINQVVAEKFNTPVIPLYILDEEQGINAFSVGFDANQIALIVSKGSVQFLTPFELEILIVHEYSRILHKDYLINHYIDVMCYGFLFFYMHGQNFIQISKSSNWFILLRFCAWLIGVGLCLIGFPALLLTRFLKWSVFYKYRKKHDLQLLQYIDPQYFIYALARIDLHGYKSRLSHIYSEAIAHYCFANPAEDYHFPVIQSLNKRIKHIAHFLENQNITLLTQVPKYAQPIYTYQQNTQIDFSRLEYYLIHTRKIMAPYLHSALQFHYPSALILNKRDSDQQDNIQALSPDARQSMHTSELIAMLLQTVSGCKEVVLAIMYIRQKKYRRIPLNYTVDLSHAVLDALLILDQRVYFYLIFKCLNKIDGLSNVVKHDFLNQLSRYMQSSQYDFLDFLFIQRLCHYPRPKQGFPVAFKQVGLSILNIVQQFLNMAKLEKSQRMAIHQRICQRLDLENVEFDQVNDVRLLAQDLTLLSGLLIQERKLILLVIEQEIWEERLITQDELDAMSLLYWRLGLNSVEMEQRMLKHNRLVII